jgi:hypothetical protein
MPPHSSSSGHADATVEVEVYPAGPPGSGQGSGVAISAGPANADAVEAVVAEQFGLPPHLEPLPYDRERDGLPFWERRPGDRPLRRRYRVRPMDRQRTRRPGPRPRIHFTGPADDVRRVRSDFRRRRLARVTCPPLPRPRSARVRKRRPVRRSSGSRGDPPDEEPHLEEPATSAAVRSPAHVLAGGQNRRRSAP